jgi:hypothetical protein
MKSLALGMGATVKFCLFAYPLIGISCLRTTNVRNARKMQVAPGQQNVRLMLRRRVNRSAILRPEFVRLSNRRNL